MGNCTNSRTCLNCEDRICWSSHKRTFEHILILSFLTSINEFCFRTRPVTTINDGDNLLAVVSAFPVLRSCRMTAIRLRDRLSCQTAACSLTSNSSVMRCFFAMINSCSYSVQIISSVCSHLVPRQIYCSYLGLVRDSVYLREVTLISHYNDNTLRYITHYCFC
jgi:hypothetical protein